MVTNLWLFSTLHCFLHFCAPTIPRLHVISCELQAYDCFLYPFLFSAYRHPSYRFASMNRLIVPCSVAEQWHLHCGCVGMPRLSCRFHSKRKRNINEIDLDTFTCSTVVNGVCGKKYSHVQLHASHFPFFSEFHFFRMTNDMIDSYFPRWIWFHSRAAAT